MPEQQYPTYTPDPVDWDTNDWGGHVRVASYLDEEHDVGDDSSVSLPVVKP